MDSGKKSPVKELLTLLDGAGYEQIDPDILYPANIFVDLIGEDIRRRLFVSPGLDGEDMALRPDMTIPVCLHHLANGDASREKRYAYHGKVFRQRGHDASGEFYQAGIEHIAPSSRFEADVETLSLALKAISGANIEALSIKIGDKALFLALLDALGIPAIWQQRLISAFGDRKLINGILARMSEPATDANSGLMQALRGTKPEAAKAIVEDMLSIAGLQTVGGRTADEIATRFLSKAEQQSGRGVTDHSISGLRDYFTIGGNLDQVPVALSSFEKKYDISLGEAGTNFTNRIEAIKQVDLPGQLWCSTGFGRRLDYYTGFVFDICDAENPDTAQFVGGGRYDALLGLMGADVEVPAIGFSIWLDRLFDGKHI